MVRARALTISTILGRTIADTRLSIVDGRANPCAQACSRFRRACKLRLAFQEGQRIRGLLACEDLEQVSRRPRPL